MLTEILELAEMMKDEPTHCEDTLHGRAIALILEHPSPHTQMSFGAAAARLGATPIMLTADQLGLASADSITDAARSLSGYADAIVVGAFEQETVEALARGAAVPVINEHSTTEEPCQALADLLTIKEAFGDLEGRRLAFIGNGGGSIAQSLIEAGALAEMNVTIACPRECGPDPELLTRARARLEETGVELQVTHDPRVAVAGAHAVYADAWASIDKVVAPSARIPRDFEVTDELMTLAQPGAIFLHCLPATRGVEVAAAVIDGPQSAVWAQSANRLPTEEAVLLLLTEGVER